METSTSRKGIVKGIVRTETLPNGTTAILVQSDNVLGLYNHLVADGALGMAARAGIVHRGASTPNNYYCSNLMEASFTTIAGDIKCSAIPFTLEPDQACLLVKEEHKEWLDNWVAAELYRTTRGSHGNPNIS